MHTMIILIEVMFESKEFLKIVSSIKSNLKALNQRIIRFEKNE